MSEEMMRDPREVLARQKYFCLRPRPLEQWLWQQGLPPSAERVFWLHWHEGMRSGNWCSSIPLKRVAAQCALDVSSVTRAYQALTRLGLIRREDPGRDPAHPFEQAIALTEVRVPRALLQELDRHPNRIDSGRGQGSRRAQPTSSAPLAPTAAPGSLPDPFAGLPGRERMRALAALLSRLSPHERRQYDEALRTHQVHLSFDPDTRLSAAERAQVLQFLGVVAPVPPVSAMAASSGSVDRPLPRHLSVFELARLRRELQALRGIDAAAELLREVVWSVEHGALKRFTTLHATRIALKKIREEAWTRPNRMPPNWTRIEAQAVPERCRSA
jgi:hypothetical protein